jgi:hypothetical protein
MLARSHFWKAVNAKRTISAAAHHSRVTGLGGFVEELNNALREAAATAATRGGARSAIPASQRLLKMRSSTWIESNSVPAKTITRESIEEA